ncbi:hypothetical protein ACTWP4_17575 [Gracilibacillus sp. D59]|uniref:hypothetical protein n=1 Tax=Gracilibacillus sp. D59 TaxID=3457434 RepID=UPI003FCD0FDC
MKRCILLILALLIVACSEEKLYSDIPDFIGIVVSFEDSNQIRMNIKSGTITEYGYNGTILISVENMKDIEKLEKNDEIKVWIDVQILDHQPPHAKLGKYESNE